MDYRTPYPPLSRRFVRGVEQLPPENLIAHNDVTMTAKIMRDAEGGEGERSVWAKRILDRDHHVVVHETGPNANAEDLRRSQAILTLLQEKFTEYDFLLDKASASIHKLLVPEDQDDSGLVRLILVGRDGSTRLVGEESQILRNIPRRFQYSRIFGNIPHERKDLRKEIGEFATQAWLSRGGH